MKLGRNKRHTNKVRKIQVYYGDILLIIAKHETDDILQIIQKLKKYGYNTTFAFSNKFQTKIYERDELLRKDIQEDINKIFRENASKTFTIITDSEVLKDIILKQKPFSSVHFVHENLPEIFRPNEFSRNCMSQTNLGNININYKEYPRNRVNVYNYLKELPKCCIFFTAFGYYRSQYNYKMVLKSFFKFLEKPEKIFGNTILLVLGGNYNDKNSSDLEQFKYYYYKIANGKFARNVVLLQKLSLEEKKAFLRLSFAMFYFNESGDHSFDVKLAISVGTPLIGADDGFVKSVVENEPLSGFLVPMNVDRIVSCMKILTSPITYQTASRYSRLNYLKNYTKFSKEIKAIEEKIEKKKLLKKCTKT